MVDLKKLKQNLFLSLSLSFLGWIFKKKNKLKGDFVGKAFKKTSSLEHCHHSKYFSQKFFKFFF
jgi:hypothetical protein